MKIIETNNPHRERILEVDTKDEGIAYLHAFNNRPDNLRRAEWAMLIEDNGKLLVYERFNQPCLGEMRTYGKVKVPTVAGELSSDYSYFSSTSTVEERPSTRPDDPRPGDLWTPFPITGNPIAVGVPFYTRGAVGEDSGPNNEHYEIVFDPEFSPYASALKEFEFSKRGDILSGIVVTDTNVDSTILVDMFRQYRYSAKVSSTKRLREVLGDELKYLYPAFAKMGILFAYGTKRTPGVYSYTEDQSLTFVPSQINVTILRNLVNKAPRTDLTGGTFHDRFDYNRPEVDNLWWDRRTEGEVIELYKPSSNDYSGCIPTAEIPDYLSKIITALDNNKKELKIDAAA